ncbi:MAG: hypothetical protein ACREXW_10215 [Gammaproteobacteria bacterium]
MKVRVIRSLIIAITIIGTSLPHLAVAGSVADGFYRGYAKGQAIGNGDWRTYNDIQQQEQWEEDRQQQQQQLQQYRQQQQLQLQQYQQQQQQHTYELRQLNQGLQQLNNRLRY